MIYLACWSIPNHTGIDLTKKHPVPSWFQVDKKKSMKGKGDEHLDLYEAKNPHENPRNILSPHNGALVGKMFLGGTFPLDFRWIFRFRFQMPFFFFRGKKKAGHKLQEVPMFK